MKAIIENINGVDTQINTWPYPYCQFFPYFISDECRIFLIHNVCNNFEWLKQYRDSIKDTDYFFTAQEWFKDEKFTALSEKVLDHLKLNKLNFVKMCNDIKELQNQLLYGFSNSILVPHNAFIDYNLYNILPEEKIYNAILIARTEKYKRAYLASKVSKLALVSGRQNGDTSVVIPPHVNNDNRRLSKEEIVTIINQSKCGLCLSQVEGGCYTSSEYLLCGVPVVSTHSLGGRDLWYTEDNAIICKDDEDSVFNAVQQISQKQYRPRDIRGKHIELSNYFRRTFIKSTEWIFEKHNINIDASKYFHSKYIDKWGPSIPFEKIYELLSHNNKAISENKIVSIGSHAMKPFTTTHLRGAIINAFIDYHRYFSYLEIGISNGVNFREVCAINKQAVDPHWKMYPKLDNVFTGTSDDFFESNNKKFDIIFIDGLHTEEQVKKDIENSLKVLNPNGTILCHDMSPSSLDHIAPDIYNNVPYDKNCWKTWINLRTKRTDLSMFLLSNELGVIQRGQQEPIKIDIEINFDNYLKHKKEWLNTIPIETYGKELEGFSWEKADYGWDKHSSR